MQGLGEGGAAAAAQYGREAAASNIEKMKEEAATARETALVEARRVAQISVVRETAATEMANLPKKVEIETEGRIRQRAAQPEIVPGGSTLKVPGQTDFTAPKVTDPKTPEELGEFVSRGHLLEAQADYFRGAKANEAQARADQLAQGKAGKPIGPNIRPIKDEEGNEYLFDTNSGAVGKVVKGQAEKPESGMLWWKKPGVPASLQHTVWATADGQPLPAGPFSLYSQLPVNKAGAPQINQSNGEVVFNGEVIGHVNPNSPTADQEAAAMLTNAAKEPAQVDFSKFGVGKPKPAEQPKDAKRPLIHQAEMGPPAPPVTLEDARRLATERGDLAEETARTEMLARGRRRIEADTSELMAGNLDVVSQQNFRRLQNIFNSPAATPAERLKAGTLLRKY
jgi:hypothetical protein